MRIPPAAIGVTAQLLSERYTHAELNSIFYSAGFEEDAPNGNKLHKCQEWLRGANKSDPDTALEKFGRVIAEYMDAELAQAR